MSKKNMQIQELLDLVKDDKIFINNNNRVSSEDLIYKLLHNHFKELDFDTFFKLEMLNQLTKLNEMLESIEDKLYNN